MVVILSASQTGKQTMICVRTHGSWPTEGIIELSYPDTQLKELKHDGSPGFSFCRPHEFENIKQPAEREQQRRQNNNLQNNWSRWESLFRVPKRAKNDNSAVHFASQELMSCMFLRWLLWSCTGCLPVCGMDKETSPDFWLTEEWVDDDKIYFWGGELLLFFLREF